MPEQSTEIGDLRDRVKEFEPDKPEPDQALLNIARPDKASKGILGMSKMKLGAICATPIIVLCVLYIVKPPMVVTQEIDAEGNEIKKLAPKKLIGWSAALGVLGAGAALGTMSYFGK
tara:strand:+ start:295 stop:645 length:351 start_codon:yes stop_codon:yes gene_type:complete